LETPHELAGRLRLGREEFCQRLLTSLILDGPYPTWNTPSVPSPRGVEFLRCLYELSFHDVWPGDGGMFIDEFELPPRTDVEKGGAPDWAVSWPDRLWLVELKTERASHRAGQIPGYFTLAKHHYPTLCVDLTYLTPPLSYTFAAPPETRYAHVVWPEVVTVIADVWAAAIEDRASVRDGLVRVLESLDHLSSEWRSMVGHPTPVTDAMDASAELVAPDLAVETAIRLAADVAADGEQRALDVSLGSLDDLLALRLDVRDVLASAPKDSMLRCVLPWLWRPASGGQALTNVGATTGMELRLSRYATARY
jgi:hypothetical protein